MIEMATQTRVMSALFMTMGGAILMAPPNFWAEGVGTLGGYLIPEVILAIIFAVIAFFTAGAGGAGLAARLTMFVTKVTTKLASAGKIGKIILTVFTKLAALGGKVKDLVRALKRNIEEAANGVTDAVTRIVRRRQRTVSELIEDSQPGRPTKGRTQQRVRSGGTQQANQDFYDLQPTNVQPINTNYGPGRRGTLPDRQNVIVSLGSTDGRPTLEIRNPSNNRGYEVRYD